VHLMVVGDFANGVRLRRDAAISNPAELPASW